MAQNINTVTINGNLVADPVLKTLPSGTVLCDMRVAVNGRSKKEGKWVDRPNFFNVKVWGPQGKSAASALSKGRTVVIGGRLEWREWSTTEGAKKSAVDVVASTVQYLGGKPKTEPAEADESYDYDGEY